MELWDAYDNDFKLGPGVTLVRGEWPPVGLYHLVVDILVRHRDGTYLLMQRDPRKVYGGFWEATAGGSALQGETPLEAALRELREETGIAAESLTELGRLHNFDAFFVEFLCVTDCPKDSVVLQEGETVAYRWVTREEFSAMESELCSDRILPFVEELRSLPWKRGLFGNVSEAGRSSVMELWDAYDIDFNPVSDVTLVRPGPIPAGLYHLFCDILVRHTDGTYLLMQRDKSKYFFPGMWEATAGGSALRGEDPMRCALRELWEETGIKSASLTEVGRLRNEDTFFVQFLCVTDCPKDSVHLQEGETSAFQWVTKDELIAMKHELVTERIQFFIEELQPDAGGKDAKRFTVLCHTESL